MEKQKHHTVELSDLQKFISDDYLTFANSTRERKSLICTLNGSLKIFVGHKVIWEGIQPFAAVEKYNSITEEYFDEEAEKIKNFKI